MLRSSPAGETWRTDPPVERNRPASAPTEGFYPYTILWRIMAASSNPAGVPQDYYKPPVATSPEWANPAVLGLMGFGTTTMLAGIANTAYTGYWFSSGANVLAMAIAFGGIAQLIAGIIALRKGEIFAGTAFVGYGSFWLAYFMFVNAYLPTDTTLLVDLMWFSIVWALFTFAFLVNAPKHGAGITAVFLWLTVAFILLAVKFGTMAPGGAYATSGLPGWLGNLVGLEIFITGLIAVYVAFGILTNTNYGRKIIPI